jgi:mRNA-degrading endonuclease RelE of RelBE toxin-antitoxin system
MDFERKGELEKLLGNPYTKLTIDDIAAKEIYRMYNKDGNYFTKVKKAIYRICCNPEQAEKLSGRMKGYRSKHVGSKVIIFSYNREEGVYIKNIDQHDSAYRI